MTKNFTPKEIEHALTEAKGFIYAAERTPVEERYELLFRWARETLQPLVEAKVPEAMWMILAMPQNDCENLSMAEYQAQYMRNVEAAADAGSTSAKFMLACELHSDETAKESTALFKEAAELGHTYSKWCYGLNLLSGRGTAQDQALGLKFIAEAGAEKFEGAVNFLAEAYAHGSYGYPKDEAIAASWWAKRRDKDLIRY